LARRKTVYHGTENGQTTIEVRQDCEPIMAAAKIVSEQVPDKDFRHVAFIPEVVLNDALLQGWFHDEKAWKRWANDPDNARFRTGAGRV
jgi:hypothetical protein